MDFKRKLQELKNYSPYQFSFFRIILGIYLLVHFSMLLPYASEIWSDTGLLPDPSLNRTYGYFPNVLNLFDSPRAIQWFLILLCSCSILFLLGIQRPIASLFLWYGWVCLFDRNNLILNPGLPFIGWILLTCVIIPKGEPLSLFTKKNNEWAFPALLFWGAWVIMAMGYTISGFDKLNSTSWKDGSAIIHLLNNPLARDWSLRTFLLSLPQELLYCITWGILLIEIIFLPLAVWSRTRKWIWLIMILMHVGILFIIDFADLTIGMLMIHWFTFDGSWLKTVKSPGNKNFVFFDGICGLCNAFIDFLLEEDRDDMLLFAPLQGETAREYVNEINASDLKTVIFYSQGRLFTKSDAVIEIFKSLGGIWRLIIILKLIPKQLRDYIYTIVASNRIKWFGQKETCRMPTEKEKGKLWK